MLNRELGKSISILHRHRQRYVNQNIREEGLGLAGYNFLLYVQSHSGCCQKDLCRHFAIDEAQVTRKVNQLVQEGFLRREKAGRGYSLWLDRRGEEIMPSIRQLLDEWWAIILEGFPQEEREFLLDRLQTMAHRAIQLTIGEEE